MIKSKRQAKVIFVAPKKKKQSVLPMRLFSLPFLIGFLIVFASHSLQNFTPDVATAQQKPLPKATLLTDNFLLPTETATSSPEFTFPYVSQIERAVEPTASTQSAIPATPTPAPDYCIDLPIVMYHHIQPLPIAEQLGHAPLTVNADDFDQQVKYLKENGYNAISAEDLVNALVTRTPLPAKSIMLTIDDGYDDNYTYAFLTAKKYQMIVNFFIPTGLIDKPGYMNWDHLIEMSHNPYAKLYNHTTSHAQLSTLSKEGIVQEVGNANNDFKQKLGLDNKIVAYPYGSYNDLVLETMKEMGMTAAISTDPGRNQCLSNIMRLPRVRVANGPMASYGF